MSRTRIVTMAGAGAALVLAAGAAFALGGGGGVGAVGAGDLLPVVVQTTDTGTPATSSTDDSPTSSSASTEDSTTVPTPSGSTAAPVGELSADRATAIALAHLGGGTVTGVEREWEHGRTEWHVRVRTGAGEREVRIDATTGAITRVKNRDSGG